MACVMRWHQENAEHLVDYNRRWRQAYRDKQRAWDRRYRERVRQDPDTVSEGEQTPAGATGSDEPRNPDYRERRRANNRRYRERKRARPSDAPPEARGG
jgi:hypothetical protein